MRVAAPRTTCWEELTAPSSPLAPFTLYQRTAVHSCWQGSCEASYSQVLPPCLCHVDILELLLPRHPHRLSQTPLYEVYSTQFLSLLNTACCLIVSSPCNGCTRRQRTCSHHFVSDQKPRVAGGPSMLAGGMDFPPLSHLLHFSLLPLASDSNLLIKCSLLTMLFPPKLVRRDLIRGA